MSNTDPANQHYVPRYYLRKFGIPDKHGGKAVFVSAYDRHFGTTKQKKAIRSVASETDFYTLDPASTSDPYILETYFFGNVDKLGSRLVNCIITARTVSADLRPHIREHLAVQIVRTKWFREYVRERAPKAWQTEETMRMAAAGPPDHLTERQKEIFWRLLSEMPTSDWNVLKDPNALLMLTIERFQKFREGLEQFNDYRLAWISYSGFLTSDNPILLRHAQSGFLGSPMNIGLNEASELWYPLSPQFSLRLCRDYSGWETSILPDYQNVLELNTAMAASSYRWTVWKPHTSAGQFVQLPARGVPTQEI